MKYLIYLVLLGTFCLGCHESNSVEPILDNSEQLQRSNDLLDGTEAVPIGDRDIKPVSLKYEYDFNPDLGKGKWLKEPSFINEGPQRYVRNGELKVEALILIDGKPNKALLYMTVNRVENINSAGKVYSGTAWGIFKIYSIGKYSTHLIFEGEYIGDILGKNTAILLSGIGKGAYAEKNLVAGEKWNCKNVNGELHCWMSRTNGTLIKEVKKL